MIFLPILRKLFEEQYSELLNIFKNETRVDVQKIQNNNIDIPFENSIDRYGDVKNIIEKIEKQSLIFEKRR